MSERKNEATAYFPVEVSRALDVLSSLSGETRSEFVSRVVIEVVAREVDKAILISDRVEGKRIVRRIAE